MDRLNLASSVGGWFSVSIYLGRRFGCQKITPTAAVDYIVLRLVLEAYPCAHAVSGYEAGARGFYVGGR